MSEIRNSIREAMRISRMRQGQEVGDPAEIPSMPDVRVMLVPLTDAESAQGVNYAASAEVIDNAAGVMYRNRLAQWSDLYHACRVPDHLEERIFDSPEDVAERLETTDVDSLHDRLILLMDYASPAIDGLTDVALDELKRNLAATDWRELTGRRWAALKLCLEILSPELLQAKLRGSGSTESSTMTNGEPTSTPTAEPSSIRSTVRSAESQSAA